MEADRGPDEPELAGSPAPPPAVELHHVRRSFRGSVALADLSLSVAPATVAVLLGPNGAGKTTAIRLVTGALRADAGTVRTLGVDPTGSDGAEVRRRTGVVTAAPALYDRLTGRDNLRYAAELYHLGRRADLESAAARFGIVDSLDQRVGGYSTGMKTRLSLARAVLHDPELLLLDEPTSGLDPESARAVLGLIKEMADSGKTVVMCTHLLAEADGLADQIVMLEAGAALVAGTPEELVARLWPEPMVAFEAEDPSSLLTLGAFEGVTGLSAGSGGVRATVRSAEVVPDLVAALVARGVRLTHVSTYRPTLEELYFRVRADRTGAAPAGEPAVGAPLSLVEARR